jgi:hypothetical protein
VVTRALTGQRLTWIVAVPLMAAGTIAAHSLTAVFAGTRAEIGAESAKHASRSAPAHLTILLGFTLALALVSLARRLLARRSRPSAIVFLVLPPLAFLFAELLERGFGTESFPFQPSLEPRLILGLALQVPFGVLAFLVARFLLHAIEHVVERFTRGRIGHTARAGMPRIARVSVMLPRIPALALGYQERGPPTRR